MVVVRRDIAGLPLINGARRVGELVPDTATGPVCQWRALYLVGRSCGSPVKLVVVVAFRLQHADLLVSLVPASLAAFQFAPADQYRTQRTLWSGATWRHSGSAVWHSGRTCGQR